jgi:hypothetical protein
MPRSDPDAVGDDLPEASPWRRFTGAVSNFALKPAVAAENATGNGKPATDDPTSIPEIEAAIKRASDKERVIGLLIAPVAAALVFLVTSVLVHNDPSALLANGLPNPRHVNPTDYTWLGLITLALALTMLVGAWFRKRLVIGIACALYGISFVNLHYWGFGLPFILIGSWYLVRAYRLSQKLKLAKSTDAPRLGSTGAAPAPSKRYTPPTTPARRLPKSKPAKGTEAS